MRPIIFIIIISSFSSCVYYEWHHYDILVTGSISVVKIYTDNVTIIIDTPSSSYHWEEYHRDTRATWKVNGTNLLMVVSVDYEEVFATEGDHVEWSNF